MNVRTISGIFYVSSYAVDTIYDLAILVADNKNGYHSCDCVAWRMALYSLGDAAIYHLVQAHKMHISILFYQHTRFEKNCHLFVSI